jgi:methylenetetrahydrofolate--tRNA-(uracil-5-)-methyltransferase
MAESQPVTVIGGGLAGCEAAWQLARRGVAVRLHEMRPERTSPAHRTESLAELVCSNSLRSDRPHHAVGLLHEEMRRLGSLILEAADRHRVPAGDALAVDRERFARHVQERIEAEPLVELVRSEVTRLPEGIAIVATGPLTSDALAAELEKLCGESLYFYDSISPSVYFDSLDLGRMFRASRWQDGDGDYLNIPLTREQYHHFVDEVSRAELVELHAFENPVYFEGCLPIEVMIERGRETLAFGPLKPVGLREAHGAPDSKPPYAVVQLRQEDREGTLYNLVGFQTKMKIGEQRRILRTLPGLENAVFARFGSAHRNTFIRAPELLDDALQHRQRDGLYFAGQIAGVEGYVESAALGLVAGIGVARRVGGSAATSPPRTTALGALLAHLREANPKRFQPMNVNFGLFPRLAGERRRVPKRERNEQMFARAMRDLETWAEDVAP